MSNENKLQEQMSKLVQSIIEQQENVNEDDDPSEDNSDDFESSDHVWATFQTLLESHYELCKAYSKLVSQ